MKKEIVLVIGFVKKYPALIATLLFIALCINVFGQNNNGYPFDVTISGQGKPTIIFIPGFACSGNVWQDTKAAYEKHYTCHTLTMAGFAGVSAQPDASFQNWEKAIASYIQNNKIEKPIVIGHSMGGGLALALAADYPNLVSRIVVVDALPCLSAMMNPAFKAKEKPDCSALSSKIGAASPEQFYNMQKTSMAQLMADTSHRETAVGWSVASDRKTFSDMYCDFSNTDLRSKMANITCPSLILLESYFVNFKPAINAQYHDLKTANLQYASKGLHFIMYDDNDWYTQQLHNFIKP